jgi:hypothetical protein
VLLLCYTRVLAKWLERQTPPSLVPNIQTATLHGFVRREIMASSYAGEFIESCQDRDILSTFRDVYPLFGEMALERATPFDTLIADEAQDLLLLPNVGVLNALLLGGLAGGRWVLFGNFAAHFADRGR